MKRHICLLFIVLPLLGYTQREQENWMLGTYLGMKFTGGNMSVIPVHTSNMYAPYGSACWSDPATGQLLFYTNGSNVFNRQHKQMPNGVDINNETMSIHSVIVPFPGNKDLFYIFSSATSVPSIYYAIVDMQKQGGLGDVTEKARLLDDNADLPFCVVKQSYGEGYWLITHTSFSNKFKCYRIGSKGLELTPVVSQIGTPSPQSPKYVYGKMVSNSTGTRFVFAHGLHDWTEKQAICEEFLFDKECGKVSFKQMILAKTQQAVEQLAYPAYSADDSKLYVSWIYDSGQSFLVQYNLDDPDPNGTMKPINPGQNINGDLQLAPDGKIYMATSENAAVTGKVSVINKPNLAGTACDFNDRTVLLASDPVLYFTEHFPEFIMDQSTPLPGRDKPVMVFKNRCDGTPVDFSLKESLFADSFLWDLGDGYTTNSTPVTHAYNSPGDYVITFNWYTCGHTHTITDTLKLRLAPKVDLGTDTLLCAGVTMQLSAPPADEYTWSNGKKTAAIQVSKPGTYWVKVRSENCTGADSVVIRYRDPLWTALGDEYYICDDDKELVKLDAGGDFNEYKWTPTGDTTQWIIVGDVGSYFVVVKDFRGCSAQDRTKVERRCPVSVFYPNVFTPNHDGLNDVFLPVGTDVTAFALTIYNAWGQKIFTTDELAKGWDGTFQGKPAPVGTYIYQSTYSGYRNKKTVSFEEKGNITLMR